MLKRRRERDRPKAANEAAYHPNKRVLLSYESDEDGVAGVQEQPAGTESSTAVEATTADYQIDEYPEDDRESDSVSDNVAQDHESYAEGPAEDEPVDDVEGDAVAYEKPRRSQAAGANAITGQKAALGSLSYQWEDGEDEDGYDSTEEEAMAYLRSVRSERQELPQVFAAPKEYSHEEIYENSIGDTRGYVDGDAYIARASLGPQMPGSAKASVEPQEAFTAALKERFMKQRQVIHHTPNYQSLDSLDEDDLADFEEGDSRAYAEWQRRTKNTIPKPAQLQRMDQQDLLRLLELIQTDYMIREKEISRTTSIWIWSLLAALNDARSLNNDQVWIVREFGKKAILVQLSMSNPVAAAALERASAAERHGLTDDDILTIDNDDDAADSDAEADETEKSSDVRQNTLATLDTVIVLVGEIFGQRDLLEFRQPWDAKTGYTSSPST